MRYFLSLCAIIQNEAPYIAEWLKFHRAIGFEHFYLYENDSTDDTYEVAHQEMLDHNDISLVKFPGKVAQFRAYHNCLARTNGESVFVGFLDADEFLVPVSQLSIRDLVTNVYDLKLPGIGFHWRLFGSNGHKEYTDVPVIERFTRRQPEVNQHIKCIVNPKMTSNCHTAHLFTHPKPIVDEHLNNLPYLNPIPENGTCDFFQINHYAVKSYAECVARRARPRTDTGTIRDMPEMFNAHDRNEVEDLIAYNIWKGL